MNRKRILFVAEHVTMAQVVRLATLARALDEQHYEVHFASSGFPELIFAGSRFVQHSIETLDAARATRALDAGKRLYETSTLLGYMRAELALMQQVKPDLVVGDFRLSLPSSAQKHGVPCGVLINAYWSPFAVRERFPVPDHPIVRLLGEARTEQYFPKAIPHVFRHFAAPINSARAKHGLPPVGSLLEVLTHADYTLYPDDPWLTPLAGAPNEHRFLGPVFWEPAVPLPELRFAHPERPLVYVTLGSSGKVDVLPLVVAAARALPMNFVIATAERALLQDLPENVQAYAFVPGSALAQRAQAVVSNGGSTTGYQALAEGCPVVGLPSNFDQYLASQAIERAGAGLTVKARSASKAELVEAITRAVHEPALRQSARQIAARFQEQDSALSFTRWVDEVCGAHSVK